jgi:hypothetical protein
MAPRALEAMARSGAKLRAMPILFLAAQAATTLCAAQVQSAGEPDLAQRAPAACRPPSLNWRSIATEADRRRLRDWRDAWIEAVAQARGEGHGDAVAAEGGLLDPDLALETPAPPAGNYDCRWLKLGSQQRGTVASYTPYGARPCRVGLIDGRMTFALLGGSQRPIGRLYADNELRLVFLGTMQYGDEARAYQYGVDAERDMIGQLQRIGEHRWRLVLPRPAHESQLDVIELTPR